MARRARRKRNASRRAPPMTTASDVPKTTGMVEAGRDHGRAAVTHFRTGDGACVSISFMPASFQVLYIGFGPGFQAGGDC